MGVRNLMFPIALAILWVVIAAMAMVDFASFSATTEQSRVVAEQQLRTSQQAQGRSGKVAMW